jgi:CheY-like chemotaxis protein
MPTAWSPAPLILIADDNRDTREMYTMYLGMVGYVVLPATDGHEALRQARRQRPDLIVMDLQMPGMDGWAAIRELQAYPKTATIPVIILTGHELRDYLKPSAIAEGACSFLRKPVLPERLEQEIAKQIAARSSRRRAV